MIRIQKSLWAMAALTSMAASVAALGYGCASGDRYPPPPQGGTGTKTGTSSGAGGSTSEPFDCSCVTGMRNDKDAGYPCGRCFNDAGYSGEPCSPQNSQCLGDPDCVNLFNCGEKCSFTVACIDDCVAKLNQGQAVAHFKQLFECVCAACTPQCKAPKPIECSLSPETVPEAGSPDSGPDGSDAGVDADTDADAGP